MVDGPSLRSGFCLPPPGLQPQVDRLWFWETAAGASLPAILPGTGAELMFQCGARVGVRTADGGVRWLPRAFILCLRSSARELVSDGAVRCVSVRFRGSNLRHFGRLGLPDLIDEFTDAAATFGPEIDRIADALARLPDFAGRAGCLGEFLLGQRARHARTDAATDRLVETLYYTDPERPVADVAAAAGVSTRQLERITAAATGLSPKRFRRLARFQHAIRDVYLSREASYLPVVLAHGYHDQAHFIHEVRGFTGVTPGRLIERARVVSHFYNTSLRR